MRELVVVYFVHLFMIYLSTCSVAHTFIFIDEVYNVLYIMALQNMLKETFVALFKVLSRRFFGDTEKKKDATPLTG